MFSLFINVFESTMMTWYYTQCFKPSNRKTYSFILFILVMSIITLSNYLSLYDLFLTTLLIIIVFMVSQLFCQKNKWEMLFLIIFEELILCVSATIYVLMIHDFHPYVCTIVQKIGYAFILVMFVKYYQKNAIQLDVKSYALLSFLSFIAHFIYQLLIQLYIHKNMQNIEILFIICLYVLFVLGIYFMTFHISVQEQEKRKVETMVKEMEMTKYNHQQLMKLYDEVKRYKHDLKHKYLLMHQYLKNNDCLQLEYFLKKEMRQIEQIPIFVQSSNEHINTIINSKIIIASTSQIHVSTEIHVLSELFLKDYHIHVLLGNLLDNAIEHNCQNDGIIDIKIVQDELSLLIEITNSYDYDLNDVSKTRKKDDKNHGYGMKTIQKIVDYYHGKMMIQTYDTDKKYFFVSIMILNDKNAKRP